MYFVERNCSQNLQFRPLNIKTHEVNSKQEVYPAALYELFSSLFPTFGFQGKEGGCTRENENNLRNKDGLKNEEDLENEDDLKNEDDINNEDDLKK